MSLMELEEAPSSEYGAAVGVWLVEGNPNPPAYSNGEVVVRRNVIRYLDGISDSSITAYAAIEIRGTKKVIIEDNVADLNIAQPLRDVHSGDVKYFNNRSSSGTLIQGYNTDTGQYHAELATDLEDAVLMSFLKRSA